MTRRSAIPRKSGVGRRTNEYFLAEKNHRDESTQATQTAGRKGEHPCSYVCRAAAPIEHDAKQPCADTSATETNSGIESHHRSGVALWKSGDEQAGGQVGKVTLHDETRDQGKQQCGRQR